MSAVDGDISIPVVGTVKKKVAIGVGVAGAAFVGFMYYQHAKDATTTDDTTATTDPGFEDPGALPSVTGAVSDDNSYGSGDSSTAPSVDQYGFTGTTNDQWAQYATQQLLGSSDTWSGSDITVALGAFLLNKSLTTTQQNIVQAALAVAGYPPVGTHTIISGGNVPLTVAPTGLTSDAQTSTTVHLKWSAVAGASDYVVTRSDLGNTVVGQGYGLSTTIAGLTPNTTYKFAVAARPSSGNAGPYSSAISVKTKAVTLSKPTLKVAGSTTTTISVSSSVVAGSTGYRWYLNGHLTDATDAPSNVFRGLTKGKSYSLSVAADNNTQSPGPMSTAVKASTKAK